MEWICPQLMLHTPSRSSCAPAGARHHGPHYREFDRDRDFEWEGAALALTGDLDRGAGDLDRDVDSRLVSLSRPRLSLSRPRLSDLSRDLERESRRRSRSRSRPPERSPRPPLDRDLDLLERRRGDLDLDLPRPPVSGSRRRISSGVLRRS